MNAKLIICAGLALVAGIAGAQDRDRDRHWDHGHWVYEHRDWGWRHDRVIVDPVVVRPAVVVVERPCLIEGPVFACNSIIDLQFTIDNLSVQLTDLRTGPWFAGRDARCRELEARIHECRDRIGYLRRR